MSLHAVPERFQSVRITDGMTLREVVLTARYGATHGELCGVENPCEACRREAGIIAASVVGALSRRLAWNPEVVAALRALLKEEARQ